MRYLPILAAASVLSFPIQAAVANDLKIVTSIRPIASLVENVTGSNANISVLVPTNASPHNYALKPSDASSLQNADVVFWIDEYFETFLDKAIQTLPQNANSIAFAEQSGIKVLDNRDFHEDQDHEEDEHHDEHGEDEHQDDDNDHEETHHEEEGHDEHEGHEHGESDLHIWLDPANAKTMVSIIADTLGQMDQKNAAMYQDNAATYSTKLDKLVAENEEKLHDASHQKFVTFHDAYQYFEARFDLHNAGVVTLSPDVKPGAKRLKELQEKLSHDNVACVFAEPQFDAKLVQLAVEGTNVKTAILDPLGANLESGPEFYAALINQLSENIVGCLD